MNTELAIKRESGDKVRIGACFTATGNCVEYRIDVSTCTK